VLERNKKRHQWLKGVEDRLPEPIAYSGAATTEKGIVYVGGDNEKGISAKAFLLGWNSKKEKPEITKQRPPLLWSLAIFL
jgi:N-acetylneuraminic acid mutarotase